MSCQKNPNGSGHFYVWDSEHNGECSHCGAREAEEILAEGLRAILANHSLREQCFRDGCTCHYSIARAALEAAGVKS